MTDGSVSEFPKKITAYFYQTSFEALTRVADNLGTTKNDAIHQSLISTETILAYLKPAFGLEPEWDLIVERDDRREEIRPFDRVPQSASASTSDASDGALPVPVALEFSRAAFETPLRIADTFDVIEPAGLLCTINLMDYIGRLEEAGWQVSLEKVDGTEKRPLADILSAAPPPAATLH